MGVFAHKKVQDEMFVLRLGGQTSHALIVFHLNPAVRNNIRRGTIKYALPAPPKHIVINIIFIYYKQGKIILQ